MGTLRPTVGTRLPGLSSACNSQSPPPLLSAVLLSEFHFPYLSLNCRARRKTVSGGNLVV